MEIWEQSILPSVLFSIVPNFFGNMLPQRLPQLTADLDDSRFCDRIVVMLPGKEPNKGDIIDNFQFHFGHVMGWVVDKLVLEAQI